MRAPADAAADAEDVLPSATGAGAGVGAVAAGLGDDGATSPESPLDHNAAATSTHDAEHRGNGPAAAGPDAVLHDLPPRCEWPSLALPAMGQSSATQRYGSAGDGSMVTLGRE